MKIENAQPVLSVIIVTWNGKKYAPRVSGFLAEIEGQSGDGSHCGR